MSDKSKASHKKHKMTEGKKICSVGGQALMEGIMMLGPHGDRKSTRLNSSHSRKSRMPSSA